MSVVHQICISEGRRLNIGKTFWKSLGSRQKNEYFTVRLTVMEGRISPLGADCKQMWKFWPILRNFFDTQKLPSWDALLFPSSSSCISPVEEVCSLSWDFSSSSSLPACICSVEEVWMLQAALLGPGFSIWPWSSDLLVLSSYPHSLRTPQGPTLQQLYKDSLQLVLPARSFLQQQMTEVVKMDSIEIKFRSNCRSALLFLVLGDNTETRNFSCVVE